jgi:hypothetical protein
MQCFLPIVMVWQTKESMQWFMKRGYGTYSGRCRGPTRNEICAKFDTVTDSV